MEYPKSDYIEQPKQVAPDDFWRQVKRTVGGAPLPEEQILLIVDAVRTKLALTNEDTTLDIACGNGALSARLFESCSALVGVDISEYLILIANQYFAQPPTFEFFHRDVATYVHSEPDPGRFTKVLCYAGFQYFSLENERDVLQTIVNRFINVQMLLVGNYPDRARYQNFFVGREPQPGELDDPTSQIGRWRSEEEFAKVASSNGWDVTFSRMPETYFNSNCRFDALLTPIKADKNKADKK